MKNLPKLGLSALALLLMAGCGGGVWDDSGSDGSGSSDDDTDTCCKVAVKVNNFGGTVNPIASSASGDTVSFTLTPLRDAYTVASVGGSCGGTLSSDRRTYTTAVVNGNCTVEVTFAYQGGSNGTPPEGGVVGCYAAPGTVSFALATNMGSSTHPVRRTFGPTGPTSVTSTDFNSDGTTSSRYFDVVAGSRVTWLMRNIDLSYTNVAVFPANMQPGQTISYLYGATYRVDDLSLQNTILLGFDTINVGGKTFANVCHFGSWSKYSAREEWVAPGHGAIKSISANWSSPAAKTVDYAGDL